MANSFGTAKSSESMRSGLFDEYFQRQTHSQNDAEFYNLEFPRPFVGMAHSASTPIMNGCVGSVEYTSQFLPRSTNSSKLIAGHNHYIDSSSSGSSHYADRDSSQKLVILHNWYLIRVVDDCTKDGIDPNGVRVAVGGYTSSDLLESEKFNTAPIEYRKEKCKLRTVDGLNILLIGAIDEQYTYNNGFPVHVIHMFFSGFPINWNHVINQCFVQPSLETSVQPACLMKASASQEKGGTPLPEFPVVQTGMVGIGKLNLQELKQDLLEVISPRASVIGCSKTGKSGSQPIGSSKKLKCSAESTESEPLQLSSFMRSQEFLNCLKSQTNGDSVKDAKCIRRIPHSQNIKGCKQVEDQICSARLMEPARAGKIEGCGGNEVGNGGWPIQEDAAYHRVNRGVNLSPIANLQNKIFEESNDNFCPIMDLEIESGMSDLEHTVENQTSDVEIPVLGLKMQSGCYVHKSTVKRRGRRKGSSSFRNGSHKVATELLCDEATIKNGTRKNPDVIDANESAELDKENMSTVPTLEQTFENHTHISINQELQGFGCQNGGNLINVEEQVDHNFTDLQKKASLASEKKKSSPSDDSHLDNDANNVEKHVSNSITKRKRGRPKCTVQSPEVLEGLVCNEAMVIENIKQRSEDISAIPDGDFDLLSSKDEHDKLSHRFTKIGDNMSEEKDHKKLYVGDIDNLETEMTGTRRNLCSQNVKRRNVKSQQSVPGRPPPLPPPRVQTTPEEVSKAFGLKTSRSGRLLVPRLAHWCNEAIAYDLDGGIIAIFNGSAQRRDDNGGFKPPKQPEAIKIQQKLYTAANEIIRTPKVGKEADGQIND